MVQLQISSRGASISFVIPDTEGICLIVQFHLLTFHLFRITVSPIHNVYVLGLSEPGLTGPRQVLAGEGPSEASFLEFTTVFGVPDRFIAPNFGKRYLEW